MNSRIWIVVVMLAVISTCALVATADDEGLDPLLALLVEQKVITLEQAQAVQVQYDEQQENEAAALEPAPAPEVGNKKSWTDHIALKGDVRFRYEGFQQDGSFDDDRRDRFRTRIRVGMSADVTERLRFGLELRNGDPNDPVSNNTSYDGAFQFKDFNLAQGFLDVQATDSLGVIIGKFDAKKRWTVSDMQWDDDVTVEGLMENYDLSIDGQGLKGIDILAYQYILEESKSSADSYLFGAQFRSNFVFGEQSKFAVGAGFDYWENPQAIADLTTSGALGGNKMTNIVDSDGNLVSDFEILNLIAEYKYSLSKKWPVKFNLFYYQNLGARGIAEDEDTAYFARIQVGNYKKKGDIAFRYSYYDSAPDALFYVFTQSDTSRGSDVNAHRFDLRIGMIAKSYFNFTWYNTKPSSKTDDTINRWQVDYIVKF